MYFQCHDLKVGQKWGKSGQKLFCQWPKPDHLFTSYQCFLFQTNPAYTSADSDMIQRNNVKICIL